MISAEKARELLDAYQEAPGQTSWLALTSRAQALAFTVVAQAEQLAAARTLVHEYRDRYALLPTDADPLLAVLGEAE